MRVLFALAAAAATSSSVTATLVQRPELVLGWKPSHTNLVGDAIVSAQDDFSFLVVVRDQNMDELRAFVETASDPTSPDYGKAMTASEVSEFTRPSASDTATVTQWLDSAKGCTYSADAYGRRIKVTCSVEAAEELLSTKIGHLVNRPFNQEVVRAGDYEIPDEVDQAAAAIFGLHGLPLPQRPALVSLSAGPSDPADVTPAVLAKTYNIGGVTPAGTDTNRMAVAEFQGQNEKDSDLAAFFKQFVPSAQPGDEKVSKFVGDKDQQEAGVEASLDIQYIMGVAPHVQSEFWLWDASDFCLDLENWTSTILADDHGPNVHSVSYGWQGNLTQVQCTADKYNVVDANFAKVAATRASIIFASGDSGSGYAPPRPDCSQQTPDVVNTGTIAGTEPVQNVEECCEISGMQYEGYSFTSASGPPSPGPTCSASDFGAKNKAYVGTPVQTLKIGEDQEQVCCEIARRAPPLKPQYFTITPNGDNTVNCSLYNTVSGTVAKKGSFAGLPSQPVAGNCTFFSKVTGTQPSKGTISGSAASPTSVTLWASWPASSPYVTAVGATRFVDQTVGQPEMATDQFGSGGGFSSMFDQTNAKWQSEAVAAYVANPPQDPHYPPAGSFDPKGRATPDICALGEGYQVYTDGNVQPVGGTSASTPAFAGMLALINEKRIQAGKPAMGLINPFLYQNADCFTDVTLGTNAIGRGTGPIKYGFNATKGWDPATGLGSPIFDKLLEAALKI